MISLLEKYISLVNIINKILKESLVKKPNRHTFYVLIPRKECFISFHD